MTLLHFEAIEKVQLKYHLLNDYLHGLNNYVHSYIVNVSAYLNLQSL